MLKTPDAGVQIHVLRLALVLEILQLMLQFLDLALHLLHLRLHLLQAIDQAGAALVAILRLLLKPGDPVGEAQRRVLCVERPDKQHGGRYRARRADPGHETFSQYLLHYSAV